MVAAACFLAVMGVVGTVVGGEEVALVCIGLGLAPFRLRGGAPRFLRS